jgi:phosphoenolpyruvate---glycerone phosphotransferase subunit DhaL
MQARKGRASYLGPRSVGHQDPGATSTALMFAALEQAVLADRSQRFATGSRTRASRR